MHKRARNRKIINLFKKSSLKGLSYLKVDENVCREVRRQHERQNCKMLCIALLNYKPQGKRESKKWEVRK